MKFFADILRKNEAAKVIIGLPVDGGKSRESVTGFIREDFVVEGQAVYSEPGMEAASSLYSELNAAMGQVGALSGSMGVGVTNRQIKTIQSTISTWTNTEKFTFSLRLLFFATDKTVDVRKYVTKFLSCTNPIFDEEYPGMVIAPNRYDFTDKTCVAVKIGKWFKTPPLFLVNSTRWQFSQATIPGGNPLFVEGSLQFRAYRMLSAAEISGFMSGSFTGSEVT